MSQTLEELPMSQTPEERTPYKTPSTPSKTGVRSTYTTPKEAVTIQIDPFPKSGMSYEPSLVPPQRDLSYYGKETKRLGTGTYGVVSLHDGKAGKVAIKKMEYSPSSQNGASTLREIAVLLRMKHPNVINTLDIIINPAKEELHMVMPVAQTDLWNIINPRGSKYDPKRSNEVNKNYAYQILCGVNYCLSKTIINRDIKPQNVLVYDDGTVKISDFGLARPSMCSVDSGITNEVYTLWYRPPEILLGSTYGDAADIWAVGCVLYELYTGTPLFAGNSEVEMMRMIGREFGYIEKLWPGIVNMPNWNSVYSYKQYSSPMLSRVSDQNMLDIIKRLLTPDPSRRERLQTIIQDPYFNSVRDPSREDSKVYSCIEMLETRSEPIRNTLGNQPEVNARMLEILYDWLAEVCKMFKFKRQTFFLSQILVEKYLSNKTVNTKELQLYGSAAMYIASRFIEVYYPEVADIVYVSDGNFTEDALNKADAQMLSALNYDLVHTTPVDFLNVYTGSGNYSHQVKTLSNSLLTLLSIDSKFRYKYNPEEMALYCLFLACTYMGCTFRHTTHLGIRVAEFSNDFLAYKPKPSAWFDKEFASVKNDPAHNLSSIQETIRTSTTVVL